MREQEHMAWPRDWGARETARAEMASQRYTVTSDAMLRLGGLHETLAGAIFTPNLLAAAGADHLGPVPNRIRAKDMIRYRRDLGDAVRLRAVSDDRFARIGTGYSARQAHRFRFLDIPGAADLTAALLSLIPPAERHQAGTFGIHAFRSFSDVVSAPHQDGFEFGITYVLARAGGGAESYLNDYSTGREVLRRQLQPGEILLFRDADFLHGATPLTGSQPHRDALVIQFDAPEDLEAARDEDAEA